MSPIRWFLTVTLVLLSAGSVSAGRSSSLMDISRDGTRLACSNRDAGTVTIVDLTVPRKLREIPVGRHPEGVTFLGETGRLAVAVHGDDLIRILDTETGQLLHEIAVFDEPYGLVSSADGKRLWATLDYPGRVIEIDPATATIVREETVGRFLRGLAIDSAGKLLVTEYYTGIVKAVDPEALQVVDEWVGSEHDNLARQIAVHPHRPKAYLPHIRSLTMLAHGSGSIFPYLSIIDTEPGEEKRRKRIQMDTVRGVYVVANPWEAEISPDGQQLYVLFSGTDDMYVCNLLDDDYHELKYRQLIRTGSNPRAVRVSPDSRTFYVYNALDFTVDAYDAETCEKQSTITVTAWTGDPEVLLGKKLFYSAHPPMSRLKWVSCSSCHPDGAADGRTWQQPEGLRNTQPMLGLSQTHPIHWSADRDEVQDFEHTIRSLLMGGRGLIKGPVYDSLGEKNGGRSRELDALSAYTNSHEFSLSPHPGPDTSAAVRRGRELFFSAQTGCADCHSGPLFTDLKMHNVGTGKDDESELLGPDYDTPTLLGLYRSAPYLHHGRAETLLDVLTTCNPDDQHGKTTQLSDSQREDLVAFLMALPYELPEPSGQVSGGTTSLIQE